MQTLHSRRFLAFLLWLALVAFPIASLRAQEASPERIALVIGNSQYAFGALTNPVNDAKAMTTLLRDAGFEVDQVLDASRQGLQDAVERFGKHVRADKVKLAVFYYAGHGIQLDWRNYLIPVDARIRTADDVRKQSAEVSDLLRYMQETKNRSFLVILDACRDNPFEGPNIASGKGLSQFDAPVGSMIAFSTSPGNVAQDGDGNNGLYTGHLLREFSVRNARVEDAFKRVRLNVRVESGGRQIPWESTSLEDDLYLFPTVKKKLTEAEQELQFEREVNAWLRVKSATQTDPLIAFLREFPSGNTSELAQARLNRILLSQAQAKAQQDAVAEAARAKEAQDKANQAAALLQEQQRQAELIAQEHKAQLAKAEAQRLLQEQQALELAQARERAAQAREREAQAALAEAQRTKEAQLQREALLAKEQEEARVQAEARRVAAVEAERLRAEQLAQAKAQAERLEQQRLAEQREQERKDQQAKVEAQRLQQEQQALALAQERAREAQARERAAQAALAEAQRRQEAQAQREAQLAREQEEARVQAEARRVAAAEAERLKAAQVAEAKAQAELLEQQRLAGLKEQEVKDQQARAEAQRLQQEQQALELAQARERAAQAREREAQAVLAEAQRRQAAQAQRDAQLAKEREDARLAEEARRVAAAEAERLQAAQVAEAKARAARLEQQRLAEQREQERKDQQAKAEAQRRRQEQQEQQALELAAARAREVQAQLEAAQRQQALQLQQQAQLAQEREETRKREELQRLAQAEAARLAQAEAARLAAEKATAQAALEAEKAARMAEEAKAAKLAAAEAAKATQALAHEDAKGTVQLASASPVNLLTVAATPYYKGMDMHMRNYTVGDEYATRVVDLFNKSEKPVVFKVTKVDLIGDRVEFNDGEYASDLMGNIAKNVRGSMDAPRQFYPSELYLGKKWRTHFRQVRPTGQIYTFDYEVKVVAKESITVPAGTFEAYRLEALGFNMELQASIQRKIWVTPGINADIAHETYVRLRNGKIDQWDRQELVRYKALAAAVASN